MLALLFTTLVSSGVVTTMIDLFIISVSTLLLLCWIIIVFALFSSSVLATLPYVFVQGMVI
jgi:hypothetical protein